MIRKFWFELLINSPRRMAKVITVVVMMMLALFFLNSSVFSRLGRMKRKNSWLSRMASTM